VTGSTASTPHALHREPSSARGRPTGEALGLARVTKRFGRVTALDGLDLSIGKGEVHALLGENGAGKTTSVSVFCGLVTPDSGEAYISGEVATIRSPRDAVRHGIGMVHQHFQLVSEFTVSENVHLGWDDTPAVISATDLERRTAAMSEEFGIDVDPTAVVGDLPMGARQRVAILRSLARGAELLILDEPTSVLSPQEVDRLFASIRRLTATGRTVVFISHKLNEVLEIASRISVLRRGQRVGTVPRDEATVASLARMMIGRSPGPARSQHDSVAVSDPVLVASELTLIDDNGLTTLRSVDLEVRGGEIVGVAGISGSGQRELAEAFAGLRSPASGMATVDGKPATARSAVDGVGYVPEEPHVGLPPDLPIGLGAALRAVRERPVRRGLVLSPRRMRQFSYELLEAAGLEEVEVSRRARTLSGGQLQRVVFARELHAASKALVVSQPTRGLDWAATEQAHAALRAARARGTAILLIGEDLDELLHLCDRIAVLYHGRLVGLLPRADFDRDEIGRLMGGAT
jgi:general nucleoside transport system ATP-binding protein